jgi:hypothetical protein
MANLRALADLFVGAAAGVFGLGLGAQELVGQFGAGRPTTGQPLTPSSSTSNFSVALGGITPPAPRAP